MIENRSFVDHVDRNGLLTQRNWTLKTHDYEGGDTSLWEFSYLFYSACKGANVDYHGNPLRDHLRRVMGLLKHPSIPGLWRRHCDETMWYGKWDRFSRDQATMLALTLSELGFDDELEELYEQIWDRWGFMTNTRHNGAIDSDEKLADFSGVEFFGILWRRRKTRGDGGLMNDLKIMFADLQTFVDCLIKVYWYAKTSNNYDDSNQIGILINCQRNHETFLTRWARRIYFHKRPMAQDPNVKLYEVTNGPMSAMRAYFDPKKWGNRADPPLDMLAESLVLKLGE